MKKGGGGFSLMLGGKVGGQAVLGRQIGNPAPWPTERRGYVGTGEMRKI